MTTKKTILAGAFIALGALGANAADFFSTAECDRFITFGARIGFNTSNRTIDGKAFPGFYHNESWGTGFDLGALVNLNFRDYLTIQPGIFFESRSGRYTLLGHTAASDADPGQDVAQAGRRNTYNLTVPVMALVGFNVTDDMRWTVEAGPYFTFLLDSRLKGTRLIGSERLFNQDAAGFDFGFKMGTGLRILDHYYIGAHYMAGCLDAWKEKRLPDARRLNFGGLTKAWTFTIGYDF